MQDHCHLGIFQQQLAQEVTLSTTPKEAVLILHVGIDILGKKTCVGYLLSPSAVMPAWEKPRMAPKRLQER